MRTTRTTKHQMKASELGMNSNTLAAFQRAGMLPEDVDNFSEIDSWIVKSLVVAMEDKVLLKLQLSRKQDKVRKRLIDAADEAPRYCPWEQRVLGAYEKMYEKTMNKDVVTGKEKDDKKKKEAKKKMIAACKFLTNEIWSDLKVRFKVVRTPGTMARVEALRRTAYQRVRDEILRTKDDVSTAGNEG